MLRGVQWHTGLRCLLHSQQAEAALLAATFHVLLRESNLTRSLRWSCAKEEGALVSKLSIISKAPMRLATGVTLHVTNPDNDFFNSYLAAFGENPALGICENRLQCPNCALAKR